MSKCCGTCARSRTNNVDGTVCSKSGKPVSYLAVYDCWTDQGEPDPAPLTKVCQRCGRELPLENFGRHVRTKDGYQPLCRECLREANTGKRKRQPWKTPEEVEAEKAQSKEPKTRGRKVSHPDKVVDGVTLHWCGCCKQYKQVEEFSKDSSNKSGLATQCKACRTKNEHERRVRRREAKKAAQETATEDLRNNPAATPQQPQGSLVIETPEEAEFRRWAETHVGPKVALADVPTADLVEELRRRGFHGTLTMEV